MREIRKNTYRKKPLLSRQLVKKRVLSTMRALSLLLQKKQRSLRTFSLRPHLFTLHRNFVANDPSNVDVGMVHVTIEEATTMTTQALMRIGWDEEDAATQAEIMVAAELCGNNQGLVKMYQPALMAPSPKRGGKPILTRETAISAVINANQSPGMIAAMTASNTVVQKIQSSQLPLAMACSYNSSTSSGQLAYYVERMARNHGLIALACGNSPEFVAAAPGARPVLGTNPLAVSIPTASGDPFTVRGCMKKEKTWIDVETAHSRMTNALFIV